MIRALPREPREAGEAQDPQQRGTTVAEPRGEIQAGDWGQRVHTMRKGDAPAFASSGGMVPSGLLLPYPAPVGHLQPRTAPAAQPGSARCRGFFPPSCWQSHRRPPAALLVVGAQEMFVELRGSHSLCGDVGLRGGTGKETK